MTTLGEIVVIAREMRSQFGADIRGSLARDIAAHLREGDADAAAFWSRVLHAMSALGEEEAQPRPRRTRAD